MTDTPYGPAIAANLDALARLLKEASALAEEAAQAAAAGQRNTAIGTALQLEAMLPAAGALHAAALALHRQP